MLIRSSTLSRGHNEDPQEGFKNQKREQDLLSSGRWSPSPKWRHRLWPRTVARKKVSKEFESVLELNDLQIRAAVGRCPKGF